MSDFPITVSISGYVPNSPAFLNAQLINGVAAVSPGYTANLPGILIEDISSTCTFSMVQMDSSVGELVNSVTPYAANEYILNFLQNTYGVTQTAEFSTSVFVQFEGTPGFFVGNGFVVSDGTFQYVLQDGGSVGADSGNGLGISPLLQAIATISGSWAIPAGTVNEIVTAYPTEVTLSVNNPSNGTPAPLEAESADSARARTLQAGLATSQGMTRYLKTLVSNVPGVQTRLVSVLLNQTLQQWEVLVGGSGDPYAIATAIFQSLFNIPQLSGSVLAVSGISNSVNAIISTSLNHLYTTGQIVIINGATIVGGNPMTIVDGIPVAIDVIDEKNFSIPIDTTSSGLYAGGGVLTPNLRNVTVSILDYPDTYNITFVNPPQQVVNVSVIWNTISSNLISQSAISQLATPAIVTYINSIPVGQPINLLVLNTAFQIAVSSLIPAQQLTRLVWSISINGIGSTPISGTEEIVGDPESFFFITTGSINVTQG